MPTISRNIVISVALALAAAVALFAYARSVQDKASTASDAVNVIVATHEVTAGTSVATAQSEGYLEVRTMHQSDVAPGAELTFANISNEVITANMYVGDQLTRSRVGQVNSQSVTYKVKANYRAVRVPFDNYRGMLLDLQPGDHVDVMTSYRKGEDVYTYLTVPDAMVLQVNPPASGNQNNNSTRAGSLLLSVSEEQAVLLANAVAAGGQSGSTGSNIMVAAVGHHSPAWKAFPPIALPGHFPNNGLKYAP
jgi:Flp pilus assembly protein CpaB